MESEQQLLPLLTFGMLGLKSKTALSIVFAHATLTGSMSFV